ncbi:MAG TPA: type IV pilin protein [Steroidobacteraceae bacterium]|nr:type IV pilin protein [Steroidobacteraceae bacterium]
MTTYALSRTGRARGFTLIELVVTMVIVAILAAIAVASYRSQVLDSRRTEARTAVLDLAGREERNFATSNVYSAVPTQLGYTGAAFPVTVGSGYYEVTVAVVAGVAGTPATYTITATPLGTQANDTQCTSFSLTSTGLQSATGSNAANCWTQ